MEYTTSDIKQGRILIVDDDHEIRNLLSDYLKEQGFAVLEARDGRMMEWHLSQETVDLVILDLNLPGKDGITLCRELRTRSNTPVLMLTARTDAIDRILGLEIGADDYLSKPFEPRELVARVRNILRRLRHLPGDPEGELIHNFVFAERVFDVLGHQVILPDGKKVPLSSIEVKMLRLLVERPQRVLSRDFISETLFKRKQDPTERTIDLQMSRIRQKIGDDARNPELIRTVRSEGYMLMTPVKRNAYKEPD